jgi:hypothetical protein
MAICYLHLWQGFWKLPGCGAGETDAGGSPGPLDLKHEGRASRGSRCPCCCGYRRVLPISAGTSGCRGIHVCQARGSKVCRHDDTTLPSVFLNLKLLGTKICFPFEPELRGGADMPTSRELWPRGLDESAAGCSESFFLALPDRYFQKQRYGIASLGGYTIVITELSSQLPGPSIPPNNKCRPLPRSGVMTWTLGGSSPAA